MKNLFKRVTSFITALAMTMTLTGGVQLVSFAEEEAAVHNSSASISIAGTGEADNDLALEYYLNQKIMGDSGIAMFNYRSNAADILYQAELDMYNYLVAGLTDIADGKATSSVFEYSLYWNYEDLELASNCTQAEFDAAFDKAEKSINFDGIYYCLLSDLPYELYWHDKTQEGSLSIIANGSGDGSILTVTFTLSFLVAEGYGSGTTVTNLPDLDTVAANINSIIEKYAGQSTLAILTGYKDEICALTEYNNYAADDNNNVAYGDPWQLIYVFDGNSETTVVCEGYSKAFKQLCDNTDFSNDVYCFLVTGDTGGPHMWNIVQIGDEYYHVDVTNSDGNAVGSGGGLFLDGVTYTDFNKTAFNTEVDLVYTFDSETLAMYPTECASLSATDYSEAPKTITSITIQNNPTKTEYYLNEAFDPTGLVISVNYSDYSYEDVTYSDENKDAFTFDKTTLAKEDTAVTVTYSGKTASETVPVTVTNVVTIDISELSMSEISSGIGWEWDSVMLTLSDGFEFIIKGESDVIGRVENHGTIKSGIFDSEVENYGTISGGTFNRGVMNSDGATISGGTFNDGVTNNDGATISGGDFNAMVSNNSGATISGGEFKPGLEGIWNSGTITGGEFIDLVINFEGGEITDGIFDNNATNKGTITGGTFNSPVINDEGAKITGGNFKVVENWKDAIIEITNGSVKIEACTMDNGTVTVDGTTHNHDRVATYTENPEDTTEHFKTIVCKNCPINYVEYGNASESHSVTVFTAADNVITAKCVCDKEMGTFTLEKPADLTYNGTAKAATVTVAGEVGGEATPTIEYYIGNEKLDAAPTNRGTYTAKITVDDATAELEFAIGAKNISDATVTVTPLEYTGAAQSAGIVLKDGEYTLVKDTDYSIAGTSSATDAGSYDVIITGKNNYQGSLEKTWTITKAIPSTGEITVTPNPIYDSNTVEDITLTYENSAAIPGTLTVVNNGQTLTAGQMMIDWTFTPSDTLNYETMVGGMTITVYADSVQSISVKTNPSKTDYIATEEFDPTGLVLTVTYNNSGKTADVAYTNENKGDFAFAPETLSVADEKVTITYGGKTAPETVPVTVTNRVTITQDELNENMPSGIGWTYDDSMAWLELNSGFEFIVEGECDYEVRNEGTIISGTFNREVMNFDGATISGGTFNNGVINSDGATISDGTFNNGVTNNDGATISGGDFNAVVSNNSGATISGGDFNAGGLAAFENRGTISGGTFSESQVVNREGGTITGGTFDALVTNDEGGIITGGDFYKVENWAGATIEITNGSVEIAKCIMDKGTVNVDSVKHTHSGNVTYSELDDYAHNKLTVCDGCPINYAEFEEENHSVTVFTAADNVITAKCACGEEFGTITLVEPADLNYTGTAKAATLTGEINGVDTPEIKYYDMNGTEAEPRNVGKYTAKITIDEATAELEFTIEKVVPEVTVTASSNGTLFTSSTTADVTLTATATNPVSSTEVAGTVEFDGAIEFKVGTNDYPVIFTPTDTNYDPVETTVSLTVEEDTLEGIAVAGTPAKTEYVEGDKFDPTGLTVTATYASNAKKEIEHELLTIFPETLAKGDTSVTVFYNGKTAEVDGITVRGKLAADKFKFTAPAANSEGKIVYDKTAKSATVEADDGVTGVGAITVRYFEGDTALDSTPVNAGTYKVVIDVEAGNEYVAATNLSDESWTFTIDKATPSINPSVTSPETIYDTTGTNKIELSANADVEGTIAFDGNITLVAGTNNYPVIFTPEDTDNYNTVNGTVEINVEKDTIASIEVTTQPTKTEYTYGEEFKADGLAITATYLSGNTETVKYADKSSEFSFTPDELTVATTEVTVTYAEKNDTIEVKVNKATPKYDAPTNLKANYGDTLADVELPSGWSWDAPSTSVGEVGTKTFPATYSVADENYEDVKTDLGVVVSPKTISIDSATVNDKAYDGTTDAVVNEVTFDGVITPDTVDYTATGTFADKNAGTGKSVTVKVTVTNKNYTLDSDTFTATATINKADPAVTIPQTASAITALPLSKATLPDGWTWDNPTTVPEDGQSYGITYTPEDTANYNTLTTQVTVTVSDCTHPETKVDIKEATCTEDGLKTTICTICEEPTGTEVIPAEHKWNSTYTVDTEATCTTEGEKSIHCKNCPEIKPDSAVTIPAGHKWNEKYSSDDTNHWIECSGCDETKSNGAHQYSYTVGSKQYCSVCGNSYSSADDEENVVKAPGAGSTHPIHTAPKPTQPQIKDENGKTGWDVISDELALAQDGDTVVVDMNGTTKLPKSVLEDIEGRNIDLVLDMGSGITWTINGETVTDPKAVDLRVSKNVKRIPVNVIDNVTGDNFNMEISLAHNGEFGFEAMLTISLGRKYNDCYANLYYYNPSDKAMEFIDSDLIANGNAQLIFAHASDYAIVIDEEALGDDVSSAAGATAENETMGNETVSVVFALPLVLAAGFVIRKKLCR